MRVGYSPAFPLVSLETIVRLKEELGLSASTYKLSLLQNKLWKQSNRYTFDEIYAVDAYVRECQTYYGDIRIHSANIENPRAAEAFADFINKYRALGRQGPSSLDELPSVYNTYLSALDLLPSKNDVAIIPTDTLSGTGKLFSRKPTSIISRAPQSSFALAQAEESYRFNSDKRKIESYKKPISSIHLVCVMLPNEEFAWKSLCEKIDRSLHMSADVLLALPVGKGGIWHTLGECRCSYMLDSNMLSTLLEKEVRPVTLTEPLSAAIIFTCKETTTPMLNALQKWGYQAADIGSVTTQDDYLSIPFGGIVHTVSYEAISPAVTPKTLSLHLPADAEVSDDLIITKEESGVICLSFDSLGFNTLSTHLEGIMEELTKENEGANLSLAFSLPINVSDEADNTFIAERFSEFLAIYRACAMRAVPISAHAFPRTDKKEKAVVWIWDDTIDFKV